MGRSLKDTFAIRARCVFAGLALLLAPGTPAAQMLPPTLPDIQASAPLSDALLDNTFRIDIQTIAVTLDWYPASGWVDATAQLDFRLRPGQSRDCQQCGTQVALTAESLAELRHALQDACRH